MASEVSPIVDFLDQREDLDLEYLENIHAQVVEPIDLGHMGMVLVVLEHRAVGPVVLEQEVSGPAILGHKFDTLVSLRHRGFLPSALGQ